MPNQPAKLIINRFTDINSFRDALGISSDCVQASYIYQYLKHLAVSTIIIELRYFDRDYLDEFGVFYSRSAHGYQNTTFRAHFFSILVTRETIRRATSGTTSALQRLQESYCGFSVIRPINSAPFGRTVLAWYPDKKKTQNPRIIKPSRMYECHIAGISLKVIGLAWQQQDQGVSACATIGLWTLLHSSALNERHAVPTTVAITRAAHKNLSLGYPIFPSRHLQLEQIMEAIKELSLRPHLVRGDSVQVPGINLNSFSKERLCSTLSSLILSGYPCLMAGAVVRQDDMLPIGHANVCIGFRSKNTLSTLKPGRQFSDGDMEALYIHDDNIGPAVRFTLGHYRSTREQKVAKSSVPTDPICLVPDNPPTAMNEAVDKYGFFIPACIISAVEDDLRTSSDALTKKATEISSRVFEIANKDSIQRQFPGPAMTFGMQFVTISTYLGDMLSDRLRGFPKILSRVRLALQEKVGPISLYIGVIRIGDTNGACLDILYDTTDSDLNHPVFSSVCFDAIYEGYLRAMESVYPRMFGTLISAYE